MSHGFFWLFLFCIFCNSSLLAFTSQLYKYSDSGQPFIRYFSPKEYNAEADNWTIVQDKRGVMYFGNESGILEYDGHSWRRIQVPNSSNVRSMAIADNGTIYVCASNDFGYLKADSSGQLKYRSLKKYLDKKYDKYGEVWDVSVSSEAVFFKTKDKIFKWDGARISVIDSVFAFRLYHIRDTIYSRNHKTGLMMIDGDSVKLMPDGAFFAYIGVFNMVPFYDESSERKDKILVTTNYSGLYLHDGKKFHPFKTEVDSFLIKNQIYNTCKLANRNYAFATQRGGVVIIDSKGRLVRFINEDSGLPTNVIYDVYSDRSGGFWLATNNGIVYCEAASPFSLFHNNGALKNKVHSVLRFNNTIYATTDLGVLYLSEKDATFHLVKGSNKPAYKLLNAGGTLLVGANSGLSTIKNKQIKEFLFRREAEQVLASKYYAGRIYAGSRVGLKIIQKENNTLFRILYEAETDDGVYSIVEEKDGSLWLGGHFHGIYQVKGDLNKLPAESGARVTLKFYSRDNGLPGNEWHIYDIQDKMLLATDRGTFRYDEVTQAFEPDSILGQDLSGSSTTISLIEKSADGNLWILAKRNGQYDFGKAILQKNGTYKWTPNHQFRRLDLSSAITLYSDYNRQSDKEILWISTREALVRYDPDIVKNIQRKYLTLIRKVSVHGDSVIYRGFSDTKQISHNRALPFSANDISFEFSAISFDNSGANRFQYFLDGNDEEWSNWTSESQKQYTNLSGGDYSFHVRARNVYGIIGQEDVFNFKLLPPWYLSWWAYIFYATIFVFAVFIVDRIQRSKVIKKERERAKSREAELIKQQAEELETVDSLVRLMNKAHDLETLFASLLEHTIRVIPSAEKAAIFLLDHNINQFRVAYTSGYKVDDLEEITFMPGELEKRYTQNSDEVEKGIYIINNTDQLFGNEKLSGFEKANSMLVMAVEWENSLEAYFVFDSFTGKNAFDPSAARILDKFREHAISAISKARSFKTLQKKNEEIIKTQQQLVTHEKLASLGQLTAGIAHEIKNPLNFVNNFAEVSEELVAELRANLQEQNAEADSTRRDEIEKILNILESNVRRINEHGKRADSIVRSMLQHSRGKSGERRATDINAVLDENINFVFHGLRAQDATFNIKIEKEFDRSVGTPTVIPQNISRVFLNILQNAFYAAHMPKPNGNQPGSAKQSEPVEKVKGGTSATGHEPTIRVRTKNLGNKIEIRIRDNGPGIPKEIRDNIFNPFFSTKPSGKGTGLGLSIAHEIIVKEHDGELSFETRDGQFTEFIISLPINGSGGRMGES